MQKPLPVRQRAHFRQQEPRARKKTARPSNKNRPSANAHTCASKCCERAKKTARPSNKNRTSANAHTFASKSRERAKKTPVRQTKIAHPPTRTLSPARAASAQKNRPSVRQKSHIRQCAHLRQQVLRARAPITNDKRE